MSEPDGAGTNPGYRAAIVTGAAKGIGAATARRLARAGCAVALVDLDLVALEETRAEIAGTGAPVLALPGDAAQLAVARRTVAAVLDAWGRVDVLVNNAGMPQPKGILDIEEAEYDRTIEVDMKSVFVWTRAAAPAMLAGAGGRIVNVSSVSAYHGGGPQAVSKFAYCAAKAGVLGMTRALAKELAPRITVNAVCPGSVTTAITRDLFARRGDAILPQIPLARFGEPDDIAVVIEFLATATPMFLTGEIIDVDGGQYVN
jgi:3-oxoacyl-[acyl-carrier protein] reductase